MAGRIRHLLTERNIKFSQFSKNFLGLFSANLLVQVLGFTMLPVLTRMYTPESFGALAVFTSFLSILASLGTLKFEWCIPNAKSRGSIFYLIIISISYLSFFTLALSLFISAGLADKLIRLIYSDNAFAKSVITSMQWLMLPALFLFCSLSVLKSFAVRLNNLNPVAQSTIAQHVTRIATAVVFGYFNPTQISLIFSNVISYGFASAWLLKKQKIVKALVGKLSFYRMRLIFIHNIKMAFESTAVSLVNVFGSTVLLIMLGRSYSIADVGKYSLVVSITFVPMQLITNSLGQAYWAHAAELFHSSRYSELQNHYLITTGRLLAASICVLLLLALGAQFIESILGSEKWLGTKGIMLAVCPALMAMVIFSPTNHLIVLGRQSWQLIGDGIKILLIYFSFQLGSSIDASIVTITFISSLAIVVSYILIFIFHLSFHKSLIKTYNQ